MVKTVGECGDGPRAVDVLCVPGIFESSAYGGALLARLVEDARSPGPTRELMKALRLTVRTVIPPGYEGDGNRTTNEEYRRLLAESAAHRDDGAVRVNIHHSWGGAVAAPSWNGGPGTPDLAILSAPAWADCVCGQAVLGGRMLRIWGTHHLAHFLIPRSQPRYLWKSPVREIRELIRVMPDRLSSRRTAYESYRCVRRGVRLLEGSGPAIHLAGRRVTLLQGTGDPAVNAWRALPRYRELARREENVELREGSFCHFPLVEVSQLLAEILLRRL